MGCQMSAAELGFAPDCGGMTMVAKSWPPNHRGHLGPEADHDEALLGRTAIVREVIANLAQAPGATEPG
jgi:hypothetical protein